MSRIAKAAGLAGALLLGSAVLAGTTSARAGGAADSARRGSGEVERIARELEKSYSRVEGLEMDFEQVNSWPDVPESGDVSRGRMWVANGNRLRMEYTVPKGHMLVSDGRIVWVYVPENKQAVYDSLRGGRYVALSSIVMDLLGSGNASLAGREKLGGAECVVVDVADVTEPEGLASVRIWVDTKRWLAKGIRLCDVNGNVTTFVFSHVRRLRSVDPKLFTFEPPEGVEVVESPLMGSGRDE